MLSQRFFNRAARHFATRSRTSIGRTINRRQYSSEGNYGFKGAEDNAFNRERAAVKEHAAQTSDLWRKLSIYVVIPALCMSSANAYRLWCEHWEHKAHDIPMSEKPQYTYLNIRTKAFPWGDGNHTLFWNDKVNYIPDDK
jgi:cytochrome c oxidase subunit 6a